MHKEMLPYYEEISSCVTSHGEPLPIGAACSCSRDAGQHCTANCACLKDCGPSYDINGLLLPSRLLNNQAPPIYECNSSCACGASCANKSTQRGAHPSLEAYYTGRKGYGVRTNTDLPKGAFVCEYIGELISLTNAKKKLSSLTAEESCYVVIYKEHFGTTNSLCTCIDATVKGNITRFINHSCSPNLIMLPVRCGIVVPRLCLFTLEPVTKGTELCFSYGNSTGDTGKKCYCNSDNCHGYLPFEPHI